MTEYWPHNLRDQYVEGQLGLKKWILSRPVSYWSDAGLSELGLDFRLKVRMVREVFKELEAAGYIAVGKDLTGGDPGDTDLFRVLPVPKNLLVFRPERDRTTKPGR